MEEKYKKFKEYNWTESAEWKSYYTNIFPTPPPSKILRYKKKFYRNKIDPDFDIDYKPLNEEENSYSSTNTSSTSYSQKGNTNTNTNANNNTFQDMFSKEQTFETYKAAQSLANPINSNLLIGIETFLLIAFIIYLPSSHWASQLALLGFLVRTVRCVGIPRFDMIYFRALIMNDSCHILLYTLQTLFDKFNYYIIIPVLISTIIALSDNGRNIVLFKKYTNLVNSKREELIEIRSNIEVTIGFVSIFGVFLKINSILTPILYWQAMKFRYTLNPYIKKSFSQLNYSSNQFKNSEKCPKLLSLIIDKIQMAISYMAKLGNPQPGQD
jgi:hypothetical protein